MCSVATKIERFHKMLGIFAFQAKFQDETKMLCELNVTFTQIRPNVNYVIFL